MVACHCLVHTQTHTTQAYPQPALVMFSAGDPLCPLPKKPPHPLHTLLPAHLSCPPAPNSVAYQVTNRPSRGKNAHRLRSKLCAARATQVCVPVFLACPAMPTRQRRAMGTKLHRTMQRSAPLQMQVGVKIAQARGSPRHAHPPGRTHRRRSRRVSHDMRPLGLLCRGGAASVQVTWGLENCHAATNERKRYNRHAHGSPAQSVLCAQCTRHQRDRPSLRPIQEPCKAQKRCCGVCHARSTQSHRI